MSYYEIDLHGEPPERAHIKALMAEALEQARRRNVGLRVIHGRGEGVMARLVGDILADWNLDFMAGWINPGETRVETAAVRRHRRRD